MSICCFTGHREIPPAHLAPLKALTERQIAECLADGIKTFRVGGALGFDTLAALCVLDAKRDDPDIRLEIFVPHAGQQARWSESDQTVYAEICEAADEVRVLSDHYYRGCMFVRNRAMADGSRRCIAYLTKSSGGSKMTVDYAKKCGIEVRNLGEML